MTVDDHELTYVPLPTKEPQQVGEKDKDRDGETQTKTKTEIQKQTYKWEENYILERHWKS